MPKSRARCSSPQVAHATRVAITQVTSELLRRGAEVNRADKSVAFLLKGVRTAPACIELDWTLHSRAPAVTRLGRQCAVRGPEAGLSLGIASGMVGQR
jgi:hypothetical protein